MGRGGGLDGGFVRPRDRARTAVHRVHRARRPHTMGPAGTARRHASTSRIELDADGRFEPPPFDVEGYLACVERCRARFPDLRILAGVELGEPHWFAERDRWPAVGGCVRSCARVPALARRRRRSVGRRSAVRRGRAAGTRSVRRSIRAYLEEVRAHDRGFGRCSRCSPTSTTRFATGQRRVDAFDPVDFEEEFRSVLRSLARSGRALEVNTVVPLRHEIVRWWYEEGGDSGVVRQRRARTGRRGSRFADAAAMVEAQGFSARARSARLLAPSPVSPLTRWPAHASQ